MAKQTKQTSKYLLITSLIIFLFGGLVMYLHPSIISNFTKASAAGSIIYVSPAGNDSSNGQSSSSPVRTLLKARDLARSIKSVSGSAEVHLLPGSYYQDQSLDLTSADNNTIWKSETTGTVKISGGQLLSNTWQSLGNDIYKMPLPQINNYPRQLYVNEFKAIRATSENGPSMSLSANGNQVFRVDGAGGWGDVTDIEAHGYNKLYWKHSRQKVSSVSGSTLNLHQPWNNVAGSGNWGVGFIGQNIVVENAKELINADNEWYFSRSEKALYYKSTVNPATKKIVMPVQERLVSINGASNIEFNGISFEDATYEQPNLSGTQEFQGNVLFSGDNANWSGYGERATPGHIFMNSVSGVKFVNNQFKNLGGAAFSCFENCDDNIIEKNSFKDIAANVITLGNHKNPYSNNDNNKFNYNTLDNTGSEYYGSVPVFVSYATNTEIGYNKINNSPYSAISVGWGWADEDSSLSGNLIHHNNISDFNQKVGDGGAIYTLSRQPGTKIYNNYVNNSTSQDVGSDTLLLGIYTDEGSSDMVVENNVVDIPSQFALYLWNPNGGRSGMRNQEIKNNWFRQYNCNTKNGWGPEEPSNSPNGPTNACLLVRGVGTKYSGNNGYNGSLPAAAQAIVNSAGPVNNESYFVANPIINDGGVVVTTSPASSVTISSTSSSAVTTSSSNVITGRKVLHIGNSITDGLKNQVDNTQNFPIPATDQGNFEILADGAGKNHTSKFKVIWGSSLNRNWNEPNGIYSNHTALIDEGGWDSVVLQPCGCDAAGLEGELVAAANYVNAIKVLSPNVQVWIFMPSSWRDEPTPDYTSKGGYGGESFIPPYNPPANISESSLNLNKFGEFFSDQLSSRLGGRKINVASGAKAIEKARVAENRNYGEYFADYIHYNKRGNYIYDNMLYACLYGESPVGKINNYGFPANEVALYQQIGYETCSQSSYSNTNFNASTASTTASVSSVTTTSSITSVCSGANLTGTPFGSTPSYANDPNVAFDKAFDNNTSTFFDYYTGNGGYVGIDLGVNNKATLNRVCVFPRGGVFNGESLYTRSNGSIIQGSNDNINYTNIITLNGFGDNQWKDTAATNSIPYRYYRYLSPDGGYGNLSEIKFFGVTSNTTTSSTTTSTIVTSSSISSDGNDCFI